MKAKTIYYLFPNEESANSLKVIQEPNKKILAYYFTRDMLSELKKEKYANQHSVYFLFSETENNEKEIYIGQTINGVDRILNHKANKDFWTYGIMVTTDSDSFNRLTIDYLEYFFINEFNKSTYLLKNKDERNIKPNISQFDMPILESYIEDIKFLLKAENISIAVEKKQKIKLYYNKHKTASIYFNNGKFIIKSGSEIKHPSETTKAYNNDTSSFYNKYESIINSLIKNEKAEVINDKIILKVDYEATSISNAGAICTGTASNGWIYFEGANELR
ncbi:MAG: GIY-YIG nuclease family protein [Spirochaetales bacterium]